MRDSTGSAKIRYRQCSAVKNVVLRRAPAPYFRLRNVTDTNIHVPIVYDFRGGACDSRIHLE